MASRPSEFFNERATIQCATIHAHVYNVRMHVLMSVDDESCGYNMRFLRVPLLTIPKNRKNLLQFLCGLIVTFKMGSNLSRT